MDEKTSKKQKKSSIINFNTNKKASEKIQMKNTVKRSSIRSALSYNFKQNTNVSKNKKDVKKNAALKIVFLGGLNQIGKNITVFQCENDIIIVDCGMAFPDGEMLGIDFVIPDFSYLEENKEKIRGLVITHGHEDHIGAVPYLLKKINVPIYSAPLSIGLISGKLKEHKLLGTAKLNIIQPNKSFDLGCFNIEFIHINHSIPDAVALAINSPVGVVIHTGDFKIDHTPARGSRINLARFAEHGKNGVLALLADSTNADRHGYTKTEQRLNDSFERVFQKSINNRIIIATFASNISRIQQILDCAVKYKRKVAFSGRSIINYVSIANELNYLNSPDKIIIDIDTLGQYPKNEIVLVTTGSQGEPMSALYRMAFSEHRKVMAGNGDTIIISATPIPGNEKMVHSVVNELMKLGCEVIYESMYEMHVSGHACREELKIIHALTNPQFFIPIHGERKHLKKHADLAKNMGMVENKIFVGDTGDMLEITSNSMKKIGHISTELILVDGIGVGDVGSVVLRDRKHLGQDGLIVIVVTIDSIKNCIAAGPDIVSRGFVYMRESEVLIDEAKRAAVKSLNNSLSQRVRDWSGMKMRLKEDLFKLFHEKTRRNPVILPIIMSI